MKLPLYECIVTILEDARARVARVVNSEMSLEYWHIKREIAQYLQNGQRFARLSPGVVEACYPPAAAVPQSGRTIWSREP